MAGFSAAVPIAFYQAGRVTAIVIFRIAAMDMLQGGMSWDEIAMLSKAIEAAGEAESADLKPFLKALEEEKKTGKKPGKKKAKKDKMRSVSRVSDRSDILSTSGARLEATGTESDKEIDVPVVGLE